MRTAYFSAGFFVGAFAGVFCFSIFAGGAEPAKKSTKVEYPQIVAVSGAVTVKQKGEVLKGPLAKKILKEQIFIETADDGKVEIATSADEVLKVSPRSQVLIPAIEWETGTFEEIQVLQGSVYLRLHHPLQVRNDLYRDSLNGGEYVFGSYPEIPQVGLMVLEGQATFRGLENEEKSHLEAGESQVFVGERQDGQVQYDVLLEGRKVARGQLQKKEAMTKALMDQVRQSFQVTNQLSVVKKTRGAQASGTKTAGNQGAGAIATNGKSTGTKATQAQGSAGRTAKARKDQVVSSGPLICRKPAGRYNDCSYECRGNPKGAKDCRVGQGAVSCVRRRCLAQGEWGDDLIMAPQFSQCEAKVTIRPCDY